MSSLEFLERAVSLASKEFIRGFIIGQVALLLVLLVLGRFFFFRGPAPAGEIRIDSVRAAMQSPGTDGRCREWERAGAAGPRVATIWKDWHGD